MTRKITLIIVSILFAISHSFSQKSFDLTIKLDESINPKYISCSFQDGLSIISVKDTFVNNTLQIKRKYFAEYSFVRVGYDSGAVSLDNSFFINEQPANILFSLNGKSEPGVLGYKNSNAVIPVFDTSENKRWNELRKFREKEGLAVSAFMGKQGGLAFTNDSLRYIAGVLFKSMFDKILVFIEKYPSEYYSFWIFKDQIVSPALVFLEKDVEYLERLSNFLKSIFPAKYVSSLEGQTLSKRLKSFIYPELKDNSIAPSFKLKSFKGKTLKLEKFRGQYVLIDFWASWCGPCRANNPNLGKINEALKNEQFKLISISVDNEMEDWKKAVIKDEMIWINLIGTKGVNGDAVFDYKVKSFPTYFLIDPSGKIILQTVGDLEPIQVRLKEIFGKSLE